MRRETVALYAGTIAAYSDMYLTQPVLPVISREFGVGPARAGLTVSFVVLGIAAASTFYGPLSDALGRRRVMAGATGLLSLATLACAFAPSFPALLGLRALQGVLVPGMTAVSVAYAGDRFRAADLPRVVAGIIAASVVGGLVGRTVSGAITAHRGWRASFVAFAVLTALAAVTLARGLSAAAAPERGGWIAAYRGMLRHLRAPRLVGAYLVGCCLFFGWIGIFTYLPYHLSGPPWHLGTGAVSAVYLVYAAGVLASPIAGRLAGRIPPPTLIAAGLVVEALGMAATLVPGLPFVVTGLVVLVLGTFTAQAIAPAFVNMTAREAKGGASALYLTFYYVGGTLGAWLPGHAWRAAGWKGVVAVCGGAVLLALAADLGLCARGEGS
ncbi:MFS transporter [Anaeromyxobacter oryzae]|nr:MFS transporter [Anaeromyxobacter oryzae]